MPNKITLSEWQQAAIAEPQPRWVITATVRAAAWFCDELIESLASHGRCLVPAPQVMEYQHWLQHLWSVVSWQIKSPRYLLTPVQVQQLWQQVIVASDVDIMAPQLLLQPAIEAYQTLRAYRVADAAWQPWATADARWFVNAYQRYQALLNQHHYLDPADLPEALIAAQVSNYLADTCIAWLGFIEQTPQQQLFSQQIYMHQQSEPVELVAQVIPFSVHQYAARDGLAEFQHALQWALPIAQADAAARVAIVVPDLQASRALLQREVLNWQWLHQQNGNTVPSISFSGGDYLAELPMFQALLSALALLKATWQREDVLRLCRSSFVGTQLSLPENLHAHLPLSAPAEFFQQALSRQHVNPAWISLLRDQQTSAGLSRSLRDWWCFAEAILREVGWPGNRVLTSVDYQILQAIQRLVLSVIGSDLQAGLYHLDEFLLCLQQQARQQLFQPENLPAQIQVLGLWESIGPVFDGLWVMGLHQQAWPPATRISPLLPMELQVSLSLPRACPQQTAQLAADLMQHWQQTARQVVFSYAQQAGAVHQAPSALLAGLMEYPLPSELPLLPTVVLEHNEQLAPVLSADEIPRGGAAILAAQAACAFQAFARFRLSVAPPQPEQLGWSALERGVLVHNCLESFWRQHDQAALQALTAEQLHSVLAKIIKQQVQRQSLTLKQAPVLNDVLISAEQQRLLALLSAWLDMEKQREPFKILALEQPLTINLAQLNLSVRLDRLDQLANGAVVLIDYKTGLVNLQDWWHEPCLAPQLPLYALSIQPQADAILYGIVALPKPQLKGLAAEGVAVYADSAGQKGITEVQNWPQLQQRWQQDVAQLAQAFCQGDAALQPVKGEATCLSCGLQSVCRIESVREAF